MKTRNKIILLLALALTCMIASCESYLDTMPDQRTELNSVRKVKDLLMSAYSTASSIQMEEFMSDNRMDNGKIWFSFQYTDAGLLLGRNDRYQSRYAKIFMEWML